MSVEDSKLEDLERQRESLQKEIRHFETEQKKLKEDMGELGGTNISSRALIVNIVFAALIVLLLVAQLGFQWLPAFVSLEIALFLMSFKIILMIYEQHKQYHSMFWILNTMEYRLDLLFKMTKKIEKKLDKELDKESDKES